MKDFDDNEIPVVSPRNERSAVSRAVSRDSYDSQEGRGVEELNLLIKTVVSKHFQGIEKVSCHNV